MQSYFAYGLGIHSSVPLPELPLRDMPADVVVRHGRIENAPDPTGAQGIGFRASEREACYAREGIGAFLVTDGREIVADPGPGVPDQKVRLSILGPAMALILHQRGRFVMHASAVEIGGRAVALAGGHGFGKSTMAAALCRRGGRLLSDDVVGIDLDRTPPRVVPSYPQMKLWPDAAAVLADPAHTGSRVHPDFEKLAVRADRFTDEDFPLSRIYLLGREEAVGLERVHPGKALGLLLPHWYGGRFGPGLLRSDGVPAHFRRSSRLVAAVGVRRLVRPAALEKLDELADMIERDSKNEPEHAGVCEETE